MVDRKDFLTKENSDMGWKSRLALNQQMMISERLGRANGTAGQQTTPPPPLTPEQQYARDEVFYNDPKNKYVAGSGGGLMINGQEANRAPVYSEGYKRFATKKNQLYNDELQGKKDTMIGDINRLLAAGATYSPQMGRGSITMGDKTFSTESPVQLSDMNTHDLTNLAASMAGQVGQVARNQAVVGGNKERYNQLLDVLKETPKTIPSENGMGDMPNPAHADALKALQGFSGGGAVQGPSSSKGDEYFNKVVPQGPPPIKTTDSRVAGMQRRGILPPDEMLAAHGGNTVLGNTQAIPEPGTPGQDTRGPESLVVQQPVNAGGSATGNVGQIPAQPPAIPAQPQVPPGVQARLGLAPNDRTPLYTSPAQDMMNDSVGKIGDFIYDYNLATIGSRLGGQVLQGVENFGGRIAKRLKSDASRNRLALRKSGKTEMADR